MADESPQKKLTESPSVSLKCRVLPFGDIFDPIHIGHLIIVRGSLEALESDQVVLPRSVRLQHKNKPHESINNRIAILHCVYKKTSPGSGIENK